MFTSSSYWMWLNCANNFHLETSISLVVLRCSGLGHHFINCSPCSHFLNFQNKSYSEFIGLEIQGVWFCTPQWIGLLWAGSNAISSTHRTGRQCFSIIWQYNSTGTWGNQGRPFFREEGTLSTLREEVLEAQETDIRGAQGQPQGTFPSAFLERCRLVINPDCYWVAEISHILSSVCCNFIRPCVRIHYRPASILLSSDGAILLMWHLSHIRTITNKQK